MGAAISFFQSRFTSKYVKEDLIAGITVGLVLVPQSLAYAQLAGLPPQYGLYASLLPPLIAAFLGSSAQLATGPVAVLSLMTLSTITPLATVGSAEFISYAILLAFLVGSFMLLMGIFKLGEFVSLLSHPVIYGFTNAAALIIASTQLPSLFGFTVPSHEHQYQTVFLLFQRAATNIHIETFFLGCLAIALMWILKKLDKRLPSILIVTIVASFSVWIFKYPTVLIGSIPEGLPSFIIPTITGESARALIVAAMTMSLIGFTEAIAVAQAIAVKTKERIDPNKELIGQGIANIVGSFGRGFPISGSFSRTALNFEAGAKTWMSSLFTSLMVLAALLFFTDYLAYLPKVILASIIILSVANLIDFKKIKSIWNVSRFDAISALLTFFSTLYFAPDLEQGILIGVLFSLGSFVYKSTHPRIAFLSKYKDNSLHDADSFDLEVCENIAVVRLDAPLFFANAKYFENEIISYLADHKYVHSILFVASAINDIDATGEEMLAEFTRQLKASKKGIYFSSVKTPVKEVLAKTGIVDLVGKKHFFNSTYEAVQFLLIRENHAHTHTDRKKCPLLKYVRNTSKEKMVQEENKRAHVAYMYSKLFGR